VVLPEQAAAALPSTPAALPQTRIGAVTGALTRERLELAEDVPPAVVTLPGRQIAAAEPTALPQTVTGATTGTESTEPFAAGARTEGVAQPAAAEPSTPTALPQTFTGAVTGMSMTERDELPDDGLADDVLPALVDEAVTWPPSTETALPPMCTGALIGMLITEPCLAPVLPGVCTMLLLAE
jgi:hypothetical protein